MKNLFLIALVFCGSAVAGKHTQEADKFTGEVKQYYESTSSEVKVNKGVSYFITPIDRKEDMGIYRMVITPRGKIVDCDRYDILFKRPDKTIVKKGADHLDHKSCVIRVLPEEVAGVFEMRIPIYRQAPIDVNFNGASFDRTKFFPEQN